MTARKLRRPMMRPDTLGIYHTVVPHPEWAEPDDRPDNVKPHPRAGISISTTGTRSIGPGQRAKRTGRGGEQ